MSGLFPSNVHQNNGVWCESVPETHLHKFSLWFLRNLFLNDGDIVMNGHRYMAYSCGVEVFWHGLEAGRVKLAVKPDRV